MISTDPAKGLCIYHQDYLPFTKDLSLRLDWASSTFQKSSSDEKVTLDKSSSDHVPPNKTFQLNENISTHNTQFK